MAPLYKGVTLTRYPLMLTTQISHSRILVTFPRPPQKVLVQLHDPTHCRYVEVTSVAMGLISIYLPQLSDRLLQNPFDFRTLSICIANLDHVESIEKPALQRLFNQMQDRVQLPQNRTCVPAHKSIGEGFLLYRALRTLDLNDAANQLRNCLMTELDAKPLASYVVQRLWWSFQHTSERLQWLDALLISSTRFKIREATREGGYIFEFLQGEMCFMKAAERQRIEIMYHAYRKACYEQSVRFRAKGQLKRAIACICISTSNVHDEAAGEGVPVVHRAEERKVID